MFPQWQEGSLAERSKALDSSSSLFGGVGSNPTWTIFFFDKWNSDFTLQVKFEVYTGAHLIFDMWALLHAQKKKKKRKSHQRDSNPWPLAY